MSTNLITGYGGKAHITAEGDGAVNAALFGSGRYVLEVGDQFAYELVSNNLIKVKSGYAIDQGRKIELALNDYEELTIDNGLQGVKRCDLVVITYEKNIETGIETAIMNIIKGTSGDDYTDPEYTVGDILSGETKDDFPLYRIKLNGLSVEAVEPLYETMKSVGTMDVEDNTVSFKEASALGTLTSGEKLNVAFGKIALAIRGYIGHIAKNATASVLGHVKLSSSTSVTDSTGLALPATEKNADINGTLANQINKKAPTSHASTGTTYGIGNASNYGHVKLSDVYTSLVGAAANAIGASQSALYNAYKTLNDKFAKYLPLAGGTVTGNLGIKNGKLLINNTSTANAIVSVTYGDESGNLQCTDAGNFGLYSNNDSAYIFRRDATGYIYIGNSSTSCIEFVPNISIEHNWLLGIVNKTSVCLMGINSSNNIHIGDYQGEDISPVYLHAKGMQYDFLADAFRAHTTNKVSIGASGYLFTTVFAKTGTINTSDRTKKHDIYDLTEEYEKLFLMLQPKSFVFNDGDRVHIGAISQDVEDAMQKLGIEPEKFAGFCKDIRYEYTEYNEEDGTPVESSKVPCKDEDGNIIYDYALRYQEFIFLTIHMVQKLWARTEALENENREIKEQLQSMKQDIAELKKVSA